MPRAAPVTIAILPSISKSSSSWKLWLGEPDFRPELSAERRIVE
jgi:hypothetical protein